MKNNLKSLERNQLKVINGGVPACPENLECGPGKCCINGGCRPISEAGPNGLCMAPPIE